MDVLDVDVDVLLDVLFDVFFDVDSEVEKVECALREGDTQSCGTLSRRFRVFVARSLLVLVLVNRGEEREGDVVADEMKEEESRLLRVVMGGSFSDVTESSIGTTSDRIVGELCSTRMRKGGKWNGHKFPSNLAIRCIGIQLESYSPRPLSINASLESL